MENAGWPAVTGRGMGFLGALRGLACGVVIGLVSLGQSASAQMTTSGAFQVDDSGNANFTLPIVVPPGTGGVVPSLSLVYSSQGRNGPFGIGWSLNGISVISRCPRTLPQDNVRGGVKFDANDRFCMDGQRLMVTGGGTYGAADVVYRTELDSLSKVTTVGTVGSGPASFMVKTKSGLILEYGYTADSRIEAQGRSDVRVWALNKITDTVGNYMKVTYYKDAANGEFRPLRLDYTGNAGMNLSPFASVRLVYEDRPDKVVAYDHGDPVTTSKRASAIQMYMGDTLVTNYKLTYNASSATGSSLLAGVQQCDGGGNCLPSVSLSWSGTAPSSLTSAATQTGWDVTGPSSSVLAVGDVTGDGRPDVVKYEPATGIVRVRVNSGGFAFAAEIDSTLAGGGDMKTRSFQLADINGDGKEDVLIYRPVDGMIDVALSNGNGSFAPAVSTSFRTVPTQIVFPAYNNHTADGPAYFLDLNDYNGDGYPDISLVKPGICSPSSSSDAQSWVAYGNGSGGFGTAQALNFTVCNWYGEYSDFIIGTTTSLGVVSNIIFSDFDGDGSIDREIFYNSTIVYGSTYSYGDCHFFSNGIDGTGINSLNGNFSVNGSIYYCPNNSSSSVRSVSAAPSIDTNGDGNMDYMALSLSQPGAFGSGLGRGNGAFAAETNGSLDLGALSNYPWVSIADINGDGLSDIVAVASGTNGGAANVYYARRTSAGTAYTKTSTNINVGGDATNTWVQIADFDGDGSADVFVYSANDGTVRIWRQQGALPDRVTKFKDGLESGVTVTYGSLMDAGVYTKDTNATGSIVDLAAAIPVVRQIATDDGVGGVRRTQYSYGGLKAERNGRGVLGFRWVQETQLETGAVTRREYAQTWPYTGLLTKQVLQVPATPGGTLSTLSTITNAYACLQTGDGSACVVAPGKVYFPYAAQKVEQAWDLTGTAVPTVTTTATYDRFGNALQIAATTSDGWGKTTVNTYTNDEANWLLGRLTGTTVTSTAPTVTP